MGPCFNFLCRIKPIKALNTIDWRCHTKTMFVLFFLPIISSAIFSSVSYINCSFERFSPLALIYALWHAEEVVPQHVPEPVLEPVSTYRPAATMVAINVSVYVTLILLRIKFVKRISFVSLQALEVICVHALLTTVGTALCMLCLTGIGLSTISKISAILMFVRTGISAFAAFVYSCRNKPSANSYDKLFESITSHRCVVMDPKSSHYNLVTPEVLCCEPSATFLYRHDIHSNYLRCAKPYTSMALTRTPTKPYPHLLVFKCITSNNSVSRFIANEYHADSTSSRQLALLGDS